MRAKFYATLRRIVGGKAVEIGLEPGDTVRSVLLRLTERFPALKPEMWSCEGQLFDYVHVFVNGREFKYLPDRLETVLQEKDVLDVFPPVAGGAPPASARQTT